MDKNENRLDALDLNQQAVMLIKAGNHETADVEETRFFLYGAIASVVVFLVMLVFNASC